MQKEVFGQCMFHCRKDNGASGPVFVEEKERRNFGLTFHFPPFEPRS